jgi:hypothetical protein
MLGNLVWALVLALFTSSCAVAPMVGATTMLATGRGVGDHALGYAVSQDCNMIRILDSRDICHKYRSRYEDEYTVIDDIFYWWPSNFDR